MTALSIAETKAQIRSTIRQKRMSLDQSYRDDSRQAILHRFLELGIEIQGKVIAGFFSQNGEIDITNVMNFCLAQSAKVVVPVIDFTDNTMQFQYWNQETRLVKNKFGIEEPVVDSQQVASPSDIDTVLYPLVAFDSHCQRLGMGGGYYDKYFSFLLDNEGNTAASKPKLIGCAFECQHVDVVPVEPWDIALDAVITEAKMYKKDQ